MKWKLDEIMNERNHQEEKKQKTNKQTKKKVNWFHPGSSNLPTPETVLKQHRKAGGKNHSMGKGIVLTSCGYGLCQTESM